MILRDSLCGKPPLRCPGSGHPRPGPGTARVRLPLFARILTAWAFLVILSGPLRAGAPTAAVETTPFSGSLATGWSSLYMFRGVNQLPGASGYGSGISWTALTLDWSPTAEDSFTLASWSAVGLSQTDYKEIDASLTYTRTLGAFTLSAGYALYAVLSSPGGLYCHELLASASYAAVLGPVTLTPSLNYSYTIGPAPGDGGYVGANTGYLEARLDADWSIYRDVIHAAPWLSTGFNFGYNTSDTYSPFTGADHFELGLSLPIALAKNLSLEPFLAYSHSWRPLADTRRDTAWAGVSCILSF